MNCGKAIPLVMNLTWALATAIHAVQSDDIPGSEWMRLRKIVLTTVESSTNP